jgi:hypothetical protein
LSGEDAESDSDGNDSDEHGIDQPENVIEGNFYL